jgi:hypothetical protein
VSSSAAGTSKDICGEDRSFSIHREGTSQVADDCTVFIAAQ